jgi:hypothetical protein
MARSRWVAAAITQGQLYVAVQEAESTHSPWRERSLDHLESRKTGGC